MTFTNLITDYVVDYCEHENVWILLDSERTELLTKPSLREIRQWVEDEEKKEKKVEFQRVGAFMYDPHSYTTKLPIVVTVTGQPDPEHYWVSFVRDYGSKGRAKVSRKRLFALNVWNEGRVKRATAEIQKAGEAKKLANEFLGQLESFVHKPA